MGTAPLLEGRADQRDELNVFNQFRTSGTEGHPVHDKAVVLQQGCIALGETPFQNPSC